MLELIRYVHLNPLRAGIVKTVEGLESYQWCGHRQLLGKTSREVLTEQSVLSHFSKHRRTARDRYSQFVAEGVGASVKAKLSTGGKRTSVMLDTALDEDGLFDDRILGGGDFVGRVLNMAGQPPSESKQSFDDIIAQVAKYYGLGPLRLSMPGKERRLVRAKAVLCYFAVRHAGIKGVDVARMFAYTPAAASHAANRGEMIVQRDQELQAILRMKL